VVDSLLAGIVAGLASWAVTKQQGVIAVVAITVGLVVLAALLTYARRTLRTANASIGVRFASGTAIDTATSRIQRCPYADEDVVFPQ